MQAASALLTPFEAEFGELQSKLQKQHQDIREEISLAERKASDQERDLQRKERDAAHHQRYIDSLFRRRCEQDNEEARKFRLQANERESSAFDLPDRLRTMY